MLFAVLSTQQNAFLLYAHVFNVVYQNEKLFNFNISDKLHHLYHGDDLIIGNG